MVPYSWYNSAHERFPITSCDSNNDRIFYWSRKLFLFDSFALKCSVVYRGNCNGSNRNDADSVP